MKFNLRSVSLWRGGGSWARRRGRKKSFNSTWHFISLFTSLFRSRRLRQRANSITNSDASFPGSSIKLFFNALPPSIHRNSFRVPFFLHTEVCGEKAKEKSSNKLHFAHIWFDYNLCGLGKAEGKLLKLLRFAGEIPLRSNQYFFLLLSALFFFYVNWVKFSHTHCSLSPFFCSSRGLLRRQKIN